MKTCEEFMAEIYKKRDQKLAQRKRRQKWAAACLPLAVLLILGGVFGSTRLGGGEGVYQRYSAAADSIPRLLQVGKPTAPTELNGYDLWDWAMLERASYENTKSEPSPSPSAGGNEAVSSSAYAAEDKAETTEETEEERPRALAEAVLIDEDFPAALNDFARDSTVLLSESFGENGCYSPLSLYYALALCGSGAGGSTEQDFQNLLYDKGNGWAQKQCGNYYRQHYCSTESKKFQLANSLWLDGHYSFEDDFITGAQDDFYSALFQADFTDPALGEEMTKWVSENTNGLLQPGFEFSDDQMLSIINTVYYSAQWTDEFLEENNTEENFYKADGSAVQTEFMHNTDLNSVYKGKNFLRASLYLRGRDEMIFILPDEGVSPKELLNDPAAFEEMFYSQNREKYTYCRIEWSVPKFSFNSEYDLSHMLQALGLKNAFNPKAADFSNMSPDQPYLSQARQGTRIGIDEVGVEAAAYTELAMNAGAAMPEETIEMNLDRPFLFAILGNNTTVEERTNDPSVPDSDSILFVGVCGDPTAAGD